MKTVLHDEQFRNMCAFYRDRLIEVREGGQAIVDEYNEILDCMVREYDSCRPNTSVEGEKPSVVAMYFENCQYLDVVVDRNEVRLNAPQSVKELNERLYMHPSFANGKSIDVTFSVGYVLYASFKHQLDYKKLNPDLHNSINKLEAMMERLAFCGMQVELDNDDLVFFNSIGRFLNKVGDLSEYKVGL